MRGFLARAGLLVGDLLASFGLGGGARPPAVRPDATTLLARLGPSAVLTAHAAPGANVMMRAVPGAVLVPLSGPSADVAPQSAPDASLD